MTPTTYIAKMLLLETFLLTSQFSCYYYRGSVAEWLGSRTCDQQVAGSNPGRRECNPGQAVYIYGRMYCILSPNQQCQRTEVKNITFHGLAQTKLTWGSSNFVLTTKGFITLVEGCRASHQPSDSSTLETGLPPQEVPSSATAGLYRPNHGDICWGTGPRDMSW